MLTYQNDTRLTYIDQDGGQNADLGYDDLGRPVVHRWESFDTDDLGEGDLIVGFEHADSSGNSLYDRVHNKKIEYKMHDEVNSEMYTYDSAYRLTDPSSSTQNGFRRGEFEDGDRDSMATEDVNYYQDWELDGLGNWQSVWKNSATDQTRTHSDFNEIVNNNGTTLTHDTNGNLTDDGTVTIEYDALNRIKEVTRKSDSQTIAKYVYDANNRRMQKVVTNGGLPDDASLNGTTRFYYHGWRVLEERDGSGDLLRQYTYGNYLDEVWTIDDRDGVTVAQLNDDSGSQRHFAHSNTLYHVYSITDEDGNLVEAYQYDAYGKATVLTDGNSNGTVDFDGTDDTADWSSVANPYQYTGQRYDPEAGWMYYKNRYYDADLGRFISRDPIGYKDGLNLYEYVNSSPVMHTDLFGLTSAGEFSCMNQCTNPLNAKTCYMCCTLLCRSNPNIGYKNGVIIGKAVCSSAPSVMQSYASAIQQCPDFIALIKDAYEAGKTGKEILDILKKNKGKCKLKPKPKPKPKPQLPKKCKPTKPKPKPKVLPPLPPDPGPPPLPDPNQPPRICIIRWIVIQDKNGGPPWEIPIYGPCD